MLGYFRSSVGELFRSCIEPAAVEGPDCEVEGINEVEEAQAKPCCPRHLHRKDGEGQVQKSTLAFRLVCRSQALMFSGDVAMAALLRHDASRNRCSLLTRMLGLTSYAVCVWQCPNLVNLEQ
jgi:hypothetical protein